MLVGTASPFESYQYDENRSRIFVSPSAPSSPSPSPSSTATSPLWRSDVSELTLAGGAAPFAGGKRVDITYEEFSVMHELTRERQQLAAAGRRRHRRAQ